MIKPNERVSQTPRCHRYGERINKGDDTKFENEPIAERRHWYRTSQENKDDTEKERAITREEIKLQSHRANQVNRCR